MNAKPTRLSVETHSIDFVPTSQRYGTPLRLFTIWLSINLSIVCLTVGKLGIGAGLSLGWTVAAVALGNAIGTIFMAAHSSQGPHLGIPQMVQSRAQFGVLGAALPLLAVVATFTLFTTANAIVLRELLKTLIPLGDTGVLTVFGLVTLLIAFVGYELIHRLGALLAVLSAALFLVATLILLLPPHAHQAAATLQAAGFHRAAFLLTLTQAAAWSLSYAPYVADYSRYLPANSSTAKTFWMTGLGNFLGATSIMAVGAFLASRYPAIAADPGTGIASLFGGLSPLISVLIIVGVLEGNVMNVYSAYMSTITMLSGFNSKANAGLWVKFVLMAALIAIATLIALLAQSRFDQYFADMLNVLVYMLVPWSAINLADYYIVRRGNYVIADLFKVDGIYGRYRWTGIFTYLTSIAVQIPLMSLSFYTGPIARWIGADLAWVPGIVVPTILYFLLERSFPLRSR